MSIPQLSQEALKLLGQYDTPTICNVIELFDVRPRHSGYMDGRIRACMHLDVTAPMVEEMVGYVREIVRAA